MRFYTQYHALFEQLHSHTLILTPNRRLARFVTSQYGAWQQTQGAQAWPSLQCVSWQGWIQRQWEALQVTGGHPLSNRVMLNTAQERQLWIATIAADNDEHDLLVPDALGEVAAQAWQNLVRWRRTLSDLPEDLEEVVLFKRWASAFEERCTSLEAIDVVGTQSAVVEAFAASSLPAPEHIVLLGFDELNPLQQHLLDTLSDVGCEVQQQDIRLESSVHRLELPDVISELRHAACWAAALVEANQNVRIGLVVPQLAQLRPQIEQIFTQVFEPQYCLPDRPRHANAFNISAAQPLAQTPIIGAALDLLQLNRHHVERDQVSRLLHSPFISVQSEEPARVLLDQFLQGRYLRLSLNVLRTESGVPSQREGEPRCPQLHQQLHDFGRCIAPYRGRLQSYTAWADLFAQQLQVLGWPGERELDTLEFQQASHWPELLQNLVQLDSVNQPVSVEQALSDLNHLAYTPFHAQTADSPVQILGLLEAAGMQFDYLWVMNLDSRAWPEACAPNPLLPTSLQRQWGMPRAAVTRELQLAQRLTERLADSADQVIFSSPKMEEDQPLNPSPLIEAYPLFDLAELPQYEALDYATHLQGQTLEAIDDSYGPVLAENEEVRGGSQILKNQAACAFRAFAVHRLKASNEDVFEAGISPIIRGVLLHQALEIIWHELQDQKTLLALSDAEIEGLIQGATASAWRAIKTAQELGPQLKQLETERAQQLLRAWLEMEKQRPDFRVLSNEQARTWSLGPLQLSIRYDRIDQLAGQDGLLMIDYKTGQSDVKSWASERPDEPQVPLYAISHEGPVQGAAFGQLNAKNVGFVGLGEVGDEAPGLQTPAKLRCDLPDTWPQILHHWQVTLEGLAQAFCQGTAMPAPKAATTCRYCDLHSLCRIKSKIDIPAGES